MPNRKKSSFPHSAGGRPPPSSAARDAMRGQPPRPALNSDSAPFQRPARDLVCLWGFHAVREALRAGKRPLLDLYAAPAAAARLEAEAVAAGLTTRIVDNDVLDRRLGREAVHQGLLLEARPRIA